MSEWQPIETAPRDGTLIIYGGEGWVTVGRWHLDEEQWWELNNDPTDAWGGADNPTAWMPLPTPPNPPRQAPR